jgi:SPP1 gp7 family putative phage head morphogenesis protein
MRGEPTQVIVQALRGTKANRYKDSVLNGNYRSAETLVRTSVQSVANDTALEMYKENSDLVSGIQWVSTLDSRTSPICQALDGKRWDVNENPIGHGMSYPGGSAHWNCRSRVTPVVKSWAELGAKGKFKEVPDSTRASMDGQVSEKVSYEKWLKGKPKKVQEEALGVKKRKMWLKGELGFSDLVNQSGNPLTLTQLEKKLNIK